MEWYVLKSAACLFIFLVFYKLFLENISAHIFKRFYLLGGVVISLLIPLVTFVNYVEITTNSVQQNLLSPATINTETHSVAETIPFILYLLSGIYSIGFVFFGFRFCKNLFNIWNEIKQNPILKKRNFFHVLLQKKVTPHTFFSYIFLNKATYEANEIPKEVLWHEQAHAEEKHSLDILFIELLHVLFWFNPLFIVLKRSMKLNHEFLADRAVLQQETTPSIYQNLLLAYSSPATTPQLAHSINYSSFKKRFTVMKTHTSKKTIWLKSLLLLPLVALLLYGFSSTKTIVKEKPSEVISQNKTEKATQKQLAEYNALAKKYNAIPIEERKIPLSDLQTIEYIYGLMTDKQKEQAQPFPECYLENKIGRYDMYSKEFLEGAEKNGEKTFVIMISINNVTLNGKPSSIQTFKDDLNAITEDWNKSDFKKAKPSILISSGSREYLEKLEVEFQKTDYAQHKKGATLIIPPPPPPPAPEMPRAPKKVRKGNDNRDTNIAPPPPPPAPEVEGKVIYPPLPPPPPNPDLVEYIKELAKRGATFYIGPHKYSRDEAIKLVSKNKDASIDVSAYPKVVLNGC